MAGNKTSILEILIRATDKSTGGISSATGNVGKLSGALAKLGPLQGVVVGILGSLTAFFSARAIIDGMKQSAAHMSALADSAGRLGQSAPQLELWQAAAAQVGVQSGELDMILRFASRSIAEAADGSKQQTDALHKMGLAARDAGGRMLKATDLLLAMADGINKIEDPAERVQIQMDLLGRSGNALGPAFAEGAKGLRALLEQQAKYGVVTERMIARGDALDDALTSNRRAWSILRDTILTDMAPAFAVILGQTSEFLGFMSKVIQRAEESGDAIAKALGLHNPLVQKILKSGALGLFGLAFVDQPTGGGAGEASGPARQEMLPSAQEFANIEELARIRAEAAAKVEAAAKKAQQAEMERLEAARRVSDDVSKSWQLAEDRKSRIAAEARDRNLKAEQDYRSRLSELLDTWAAEEGAKVSELAGQTAAQSRAWVDALYDLADAASISAVEGLQMVGSAISQFGDSLGAAVVDAKNFHDHIKSFFKSILAQIVATIAKTILFRGLLSFIPGGNVLASVLKLSGGGTVPHAAAGMVIPGTLGRDSTLIAAAGGEAILTEATVRGLRKSLREPQRGTTSGRGGVTSATGGGIHVTIAPRLLRPFSRSEMLSLFDAGAEAAIAAARAR